MDADQSRRPFSVRQRHIEWLFVLLPRRKSVVATLANRRGWRRCLRAHGPGRYLRSDATAGDGMHGHCPLRCRARRRPARCRTVRRSGPRLPPHYRSEPEIHRPVARYPGAILPETCIPPLCRHRTSRFPSSSRLSHRNLPSGAEPLLAWPCLVAYII